MLINNKKQKKALLKNSKNLQAIYDDYYARDEYTNVEYGQTIIRSKYRYKTKDFLLKYNLNSLMELFFLLHYFAGEVVRTCQFCGHNITRVKNRYKNHPVHDGYNYDDCRHKGICIMCKEPYESANDDSVCYTCKPHRYDDENILDSPDKIRYMFLRMTGNHENIINLSDMDIADKMMEMASYYYHWFKGIKKNLNKRRSIDDQK